MKYGLLGTLGMTALFGSLFLGCGSGDSGLGHMQTHDRNITKNDFNVDAISWEFVKAEGLKVHVDQSDLYIAFEHNSTQPNMQFFIDADNNPNTGHSKEGGAEYVVENGYLYAYTTENVWGWKEVGIVNSSVKEGKMDAVKIPLNLLQNRSITFRVNAQALGKDWMPVVYLPATLGTKYTYPQ
jgi:hypothetical protein